MNLPFTIGSIILQYYHRYGTRSPNSQFDNTWGHYIVIAVLILFIGFPIWLIVRYFMRLAKKEVVRNFLEKFKSSDPFWDEKKMKQAAQIIYTNAHVAWAKKSTYYITGYASEDLIKAWEKLWENLGKQGLAFHNTRSEIDSITIVGAEDSSDNNKDTFTAEISAYVIRYVYDKITREPIDGHYNGKNLVHDLFTFTRTNNKWVLTKVKFYAGLNDSMLSKTEQEKPGRPDDL
jgi:hypothetical protein